MSSTPKTILTIDHEQVVRTLLTRTLTAGGYQAHQASNGRDGLKIAQAEALDLILLDVDMPEMDGHEVVRRLKEDERTRLIPVIMLTGRKQKDEKIAGLEAGADEYLTKPISGSELLARIKALLRMKDLQDEVAQLKQEQYEEQLAFAREVQAELLPAEPPSLPWVEIAVRYEPCDAIGGDLYDFAQPDEDRLLMVLADAEGHGISAALLMARAGAHIRSGVQVENLCPAEMLHWINDLISADHGKDTLLPMVCICIDRNSEKLRYANAGHLPPIVVRASGDGVEELESTSPLLGLLEHEPFEEKEVPFGEGDQLICFTDGLAEAVDQYDAEFGAERVKSVAAKHRQASAEALANEISAAWADYASGNACDDMTLIVAKRGVVGA